MRLLSYLEDLLASVDVARYSSRFPGGKTDVFKNPTTKEVTSLGSWTSGTVRGFRGTIDGSGNLYVWDLSSTHDNTIKALRAIGKTLKDFRGNFYAEVHGDTLLVRSDGESGDFIGDTIEFARRTAAASDRLQELARKLGLTVKKDDSW